MNKRLFILFFFSGIMLSSTLFSQSLNDSTLVEKLINNARLLKKEANYDSSNVYYEQAIQLLNKQESWEKLCSILNDESDNFLRMGQLDKSIFNAQKSLKISLEKFGEQHNLTAQAYMNIGNAYLTKKDFPKANEFYKKTYEIKKKEFDENNFNMLAIYGNLAITYRVMGDNENSIKYLEKAVSIAFKKYGSEHIMIANIYEDFGNNYVALGDFDKALDYTLKSYRIKTKLLKPNHPQIAFCRILLGFIYDQKQVYEKALVDYRGALSIYMVNFGKENIYTSYAFNNIGEINAKLGIRDSALHYFNEALVSRKKLLGEVNPEVALIYNNIGQLYYDQGKYGDALQNYEKIVDIFTQINFRGMEKAHNFNQLGKVFLAQKEYDKALKYFQQSLFLTVGNFAETDYYKNPILDNIKFVKILHECLELKANTFEKLFYHQSNSIHDLNAAYETHKLNIELVHKMKRSYLSEDSKIFWSENTQKIYEKAIQIGLELYASTKEVRYKDESFTFADKSKASILAGAIMDSQAKQFSNIPDTLLNQEKQLRIDLALYSNQLEKELGKIENKDSAKVVEYENRIFALRRENQHLLNSFESNYPKYYELKYQDDSITVNNLKSIIDKNTALIEYFVVANRLYIYTITKENFDVKVQQIDSNFIAEVSTLVKSLKTCELEDYIRKNSKLYKSLIDPIQVNISAKSKLVIIPDGILHTLPFEVLFKPKDDKKNYKNYDYLIKDYEISYFPSAKLFYNSIKNRPEEKAEYSNLSFAGFAPVFGDEINNGLITADIERSMDTLTLSNFTDDRGRLKSLPYSEEEVNYASNLFEKNKRVYLRKEASEENFKSAINDNSYGFVHVATHGIVNEKNSKLSCIAFSQPEDSTAIEDGLLYSGEAYNLKLQNTDLLVLSACESGLGEIVKGEGMMALTMGFLYSGAKNIVYSLWKVSDKSTSELMKSFYENILIKKENYSSALRKAKLEMIKNGKYPGNWGGFVLTGK